MAFSTNTNINYATNFSSVVDESFRLGSLTQAVVNPALTVNWLGANACEFYQIPTVALNDYDVNAASNRFGTPTEVTPQTKTYTMSQDKSWSQTVDRRTMVDTPLINLAAGALAREIEEVVIPAVDKYRFSAMISGAGNHVDTTSAALAKDNAYEYFLDCQTELTNDLVPIAGRLAFISATMYKFLKLDDAFVKKGDMATQMAINGLVGEVDGVPIIPVPDSYLSGKNMVLVHPIAIAAPVKLETYRIHDNAVGIDGAIIEGRLYHDLFVMDGKKDGICYLG